MPTGKAIAPPVQEDGTPNRLAGSATPTKLARYLQAMAGGNYASVAANYAGVNVATTRRWLQYAQRETATWNAAHPDEPLQDILDDWLDEHPAEAPGERGVPVRYHRNSPALNDPPPVPIPGGYWRLIVLNALLEKADAEAEVVALARVQAAAQNPQHWQAAMTFLERRHPERWARPNRLELSGTPGGAPIPVTAVPSPESMVELLGRLREQREASAPPQLEAPKLAAADPEPAPPATTLRLPGLKRSESPESEG